ncbi:MAG: ribonuclease VapC [Candidatus Tectimicrobiota bacterium]|nr:MAG: ribonuclease VapC [Candidatus Tectomicrobia bacterium]
MKFWVDTNVLVRLVTKEPAASFRRALALVEEAEAGRLSLAVHPLHVAEATYVLRALYGYCREAIRDDLGVVLRLRALKVYDEGRVRRALEWMAARNVDFDDAYLALWASDRGEGVASFDRDFARLPVQWREP